LRTAPSISGLEQFRPTIGEFEKMFEMLITRWVDGEVALPAVESWPEFCARGDRGLSQCISCERLWPASSGFLFGGTDRVSHSAGFPPFVARHASGNLDDANCSYSKFLFSKIALL